MSYACKEKSRNGEMMIINWEGMGQLRIYISREMFLLKFAADMLYCRKKKVENCVLPQWEELKAVENPPYHGIPSNIHRKGLHHFGWAIKSASLLNVE